MLAISAALIFVVFGNKPVAKGLILGTLFSIINFVLMAQTLPVQLNKNKGKTFMVCLGSIWMRYLLLVVPLLAAVHFEALNIFGTAAGIFMIQLVILARHCGRMIFSMR